MLSLQYSANLLMVLPGPFFVEVTAGANQRVLKFQHLLNSLIVLPGPFLVEVTATSY